MKTKLTIVLLATIALFCSCKHTCDDIVKPSNLQPIDWNGWNDAYTVGYTFYDNLDDACYDYVGDTILCYGHMARSLYNYQSIDPGDVFLEAGIMEQGVRVLFSSVFQHNGCERDSLIRLLNNSSYSDTCFVKGTLELWAWNGLHNCRTVYPCLRVRSLEDIYFK